MPKVKMKKHNITMDMTAMCDVAFLLLTFFILTTKFKPNEPVQVEIPGSTAQIPIPDKDILMISVGSHLVLLAVPKIYSIRAHQLPGFVVANRISQKSQGYFHPPVAITGSVYFANQFQHLLMLRIIRQCASCITRACSRIRAMRWRRASSAAMARC